jgi:ferredoxin
MSDAISREDLRKLVAGWMEAGKKVIGPVEVRPGTVAFVPLPSAAALRLDGWTPPANSIKEAVFPRHEALYGYRLENKQIELIDQPAPTVEQIVIGAHPCQAASFPILDKIFNWDYPDEAYNRRRAGTTVVSLACTASDDECFCTSVGLNPASEKGADAMLFDAGDGGYTLRVLTDKGRALFPDAPAQGDAPSHASAPPRKFDAARAGAFARANFDAPFWKEHALACLGCGICAYTCPVCHCFDIVDEKHGREGVRARNWDACQFPMFTLHASGHNPRHAQGDRQRQRIYHKFVVYPEKFGEILCTGCGNCARNCPVGLGILPLVTEIRDAEPVQA